MKAMGLDQFIEGESFDRGEKMFKDELGPFLYNIKNSGRRLGASKKNEMERPGR